MNRRARLFALVEYLRGRRSGVTAEALAERFGVTVRTIYRDLDTLRDGALPLKADRGRGGGYALDRHYTLPPVNFTAREAAVLITVGQWALGLRLVPFLETCASALDKVQGALSASAQWELADLMRGLTFTGVPTLPVPRAVRDALERAWFERRPLRMRYAGAHGTTSIRTVRVERVVLERSLTLLNGVDLDKGEPRQFRLDRVEWAEALDRDPEREYIR
ncbi:MAG TPA: HTH domain-containing protein [Vicinamibacterales bacterium]|nr:HTH domain-containing protein [Vicinamibacterales bacterium]